ncbi:hypothetical protein PR003_g10235 [Phytophthora rubi]|uniref:Retrotransposon gag domain-containing protein n=1 Tax=Phytophthora rubi TaxID=129364 RepID=A0A6A4FKL9_9STRA|nr:hypothetical protein PR001_g12124 [Phytophthora rubi]KAE9340935.1 hypothetical protein PR003_g10235 [Phytophthora rubi]
MPSTEGVPVGSSTTQPPVSEQTVLMQIMQKMMAVQQQVMQQQQLQFQAFLEHQACVRNDIFEKQARASRQISKAEPPKFNGTAKEELELWLFQIEEHFSGYAAERDSNDSRFVDLVVPYLGTDVMSWYREFKHTLGETPRTWCGFMQQFRVRFRDSDFEYKLLSRVYDLQATGTQQEYTAKFMLLLSQSSLDLPEMEAIRHAQRFENARKPATPKDKAASHQPVGRSGNRKSPPAADDTKKGKQPRPRGFEERHLPHMWREGPHRAGLFRQGKAARGKT